MPEPTSGLALTDFKAWAGFRLGYGRTPANWTTEEAAQITDVVGVGCRWVNCPVRDDNRGIPAAYPWTWLKPLITLTLNSAARYVDLPDDFNGFEGNLQIGQTGGVNLGEIGSVNAHLLMKKYDEQPDLTGTPGCFAVESLKGTEVDRGSRYRLWVWPAADGNYTLQGQYVLTPDALSTQRPYPYGGAALSEVYRAAIMAACEKEIYRGERGDEYAHFLDVLAAAIAADQRKKEEKLGYVGDSSDERYYKGRDLRHGYSGNPVRFNGTVWD